MISLTKLKKTFKNFPTNKKALLMGFDSPSSLLKERRAQAEAVFRLMIDSVVGLAILLVIISALGYFQGQVIVQSKSDFFALVKNAVNTPTGIIVRSGDLTFTDNFSIDTLDLRNRTLLSENCFKLESSGTINNINEKRVEFTQEVKLIVYVRCNVNETCDPYNNSPDDYDSCCTQCVVAFGKPPLQ